MSITSWLSFRAAGPPEASLSARACLRLPGASASFGQSAAWAALAPQAISGLTDRQTDRETHGLFST